MGGNPYAGMLLLVPYNFAPLNWSFCQGQLLDISLNNVLFALLGTTYGGDGVSSFALPDLRGRTPLHFGSDGQVTYVQGERGGNESVTLTSSQNPSHSHVVSASNATQTSSNPKNNFLASGPAAYQSGSAPTAGKALYPSSIAPAGSSFPHENRQPFLTMNWIIALYGIFPPHS